MRILLAGALGEVGRSVSAALADAGHTVVAASSRAPIEDRPDVLDRASGLSSVRAGEIDAIVVAAGRGDRRAANRTGQESTSELALASADVRIPSVLLSTTRVLEGWEGDVDESADARPLTPYAQANADNEHVWLDGGGRSVLRITNYVCAPSARHSPQSLLLPWSLVTEGLETGSIGVRSGASLAKEFVDSHDVARALTLLLAADEAPRVCATAPGAVLTMRDLAEISADAITTTGASRPRLSFGPDGPVAPIVLPGWLSARGWSGQLTSARLTELVAAWLRDQASAFA